MKVFTAVLMAFVLLASSSTANAGLLGRHWLRNAVLITGTVVVVKAYRKSSACQRSEREDPSSSSEQYHRDVARCNR